MMLIQGFDITDHTLDELLKFCERLESVEEIYDAHMKPEAKPKADMKRGSNYKNIHSVRSPSGDSSHFQNWKHKDMEASIVRSTTQIPIIWLIVRSFGNRY